MAKKLLVADDSLTIQKVIRLALSNEGYDIQAVAGGDEAIEQISVFRPDAVLIDVSLPEKSAFEVKRAINQIRSEQNDLKGVKFILMSSAFETVDEKQAEEVGFDGRLTKPFDPASLREVLADVASSDVASSEIEIQDDDETPGIHAEPTMTFDMDDSLPPPPPFDFEELENEEEERIVLPPPPPGSTSSPKREEPMDFEFDSTDQKRSSRRQDPDADIRELTESTIKLSGLDDFQWSINESAKKSGQSAMTPPPPPPQDTEGPALGDEWEMDDGLETEEPELRPGNHAADDGGSTFHLDFESSGFSEPAPQETQAPENFSGFDPSRLEEVVRAQVEQTLERLAQRILPDIAEKVIKEEIHRMLSEDPKMKA